jgi:hypothetical protein
VSPRGDAVARPLKRSEYEIVFITRDAEKGWTDCLATVRNAVVEAWEQLTLEPLHESPRQYKLREDYATGTYQGVTYDRWQYKLSNGGRIWYFVDTKTKTKFTGRVMLERVEPGHPKQTDGRQRRGNS